MFMACFFRFKTQIKTTADIKTKMPPPAPAAIGIRGSFFCYGCSICVTFIVSVTGSVTDLVSVLVSGSRISEVVELVSVVELV